MLVVDNQYFSYIENFVLSDISKVGISMQRRQNVLLYNFLGIKCDMYLYILYNSLTVENTHVVPRPLVVMVVKSHKGKVKEQPEKMLWLDHC